ncbi:MAG: MaoC family dehydratase [Dehalococcoidales bacterium]
MLASFELKEGMSLPEIKKSISQEQINLYAEASKDFNPIHIDENYARQTPLGGTVAHGMLILAYVSQMMTAAFGRNWLSGSKLNVRFKAPARPGDTVTICGKICQVEKSDGQNLINCDVLCQNQNEESIIIGEAMVKVKDNENSG